MKARIKFTKEGPMKFVGHLDTMRYFQKAIRRAELPIAFSGGYSPHMIMSFAAPLGVGVTSTGEYFDMELSVALSTDEICQRLNAQMVEGVRVLKMCIRDRNIRRNRSCFSERLEKQEDVQQLLLYFHGIPGRLV